MIIPLLDFWFQARGVQRPDKRLSPIGQMGGVYGVYDQTSPIGTITGSRRRERDLDPGRLEGVQDF